MIWVGQFDSEADFEKYMDQSAFRQWWKDYDEDNKELRCQFCKELGVMSYDEDFLIMKFTSDGLAGLLNLIPADTQKISLSMTDKNITMADLKGTLEVFARKFFGEKREIRLRPSYFPFTEPSVEVDISCHNCGGKGCSMCKHTGWIEILGAGMVNPKVLEMCGFDSEVYQGFAFGIGIERVAMLKYGIDNIRNFYNDDIRFLNQFTRKE